MPRLLWGSFQPRLPQGSPLPNPVLLILSGEVGSQRRRFQPVRREIAEKPSPHHVTDLSIRERDKERLFGRGGQRGRDEGRGDDQMGLGEGRCCVTLCAREVEAAWLLKTAKHSICSHLLM